MRPVIGISSYAEQASWGAWTLPAALVPLAYVQAVEHAGGRPVVIPPMEEAVDETLDAVDGLVFSGGSDIDPSLYGAEPHPETNASGPSATARSSRSSRPRSRATCPCSRSAAGSRC